MQSPEQQLFQKKVSQQKKFEEFDSMPLFKFDSYTGKNSHDLKIKIQSKTIKKEINSGPFQIIRNA